MAPGHNSSKNGVSRGRFLRILGKIGILSLIPGLSAYAADREFVEMKDSPGRVGCSCLGIMDGRTLSPRIKGKTLSRDALTAKLATDNLEQLRDLVTGRFFGKTAAEAFKDGYSPLINWDLGGDDDSGCFFYAVLQGNAGDIGKCTFYITAREVNDRVLIDIYSSAGLGPLPGDLGAACPEKHLCPAQCPTHCGDKCTGVYCSGEYCAPKASIDLYEIVSYPADKFASEITGILESTDVGVIQSELKAVIFSDEVLNMGLEHFVDAAHQAMIDNVAGY